MNSSIEFANVALLVGIGVAVIASIRWQAGIIASLVAAFSLNYFGVEPVHSLRITSRDDIFTVVLLLTLGLTVSALTAYRLRSRIQHSHNVAIHHLEKEASIDLGEPSLASRAWSTIHARLSHELDLLTIRHADTPPGGLPQISQNRTGGSDSSSTIVIPSTGASISFNDPRLAGCLVLVPIEGAGPLTLRRDVLLMFTRDIETQLAGTLIP